MYVIIRSRISKRIILIELECALEFMYDTKAAIVNEPQHFRFSNSKLNSRHWQTDSVAEYATICYSATTNQPSCGFSSPPVASMWSSRQIRP